MRISIRDLRASFAVGESILTRTGKSFRIEGLEEERISFRPRRGIKPLSVGWEKVQLVIEHFDEIESSTNLERGVTSVLARYGKRDSQNEPYLYGLAKKFCAHKRPGHDYLVLWKYSEALRVEGLVITAAKGAHSGGLEKGDRMFVVATNRNELYLLGVIGVQRSGGKRAEGKSQFGAFRRIPLKGLKWQLRFEETASAKLAKTTQLAMQVRARRRLSQPSAALLLNVLTTELEEVRKTLEDFRVSEGRLKQMTLSTRERNRAVRIQALAVKGAICEICGFDFEMTYGSFARDCVEVHHIKGLSNASRKGVKTSLDDVLVLCPNCHRALHQFKSPNDWKKFRRACGLG